MIQNRSVIPMRAAKTGYIVLSVLFCLLGCLLLARPARLIPLAGRFLGACMIAFGAVKLVGYFSKDLFRLAFQYDLAFGILLIALGVIVLAKPDATARFLCVIIGVSVLSDGLFKLQIAMDAKTFGIRRWWLILALALLSGALGVALILHPGEGAMALTALLGLTLISEGALNLCVAVCTVKIVSYQKPDEKGA